MLDVLPEEDFAAAHLPGAKNACVFKVSFIDDVHELAPNRENPLVVYGASSRDRASATAAEKLLNAGYTQVADYRGGLEDWRAGGRPVEGNPQAARPKPAIRDGRHAIDLEKSRIEWAGRNLMSTHSGTIQLRDGHIDVRNGVVAGAAFTIDMSAIENADITDPEMRQHLVAHLKSDDFFDVQRFPTASFRISNIAFLPDPESRNPNCDVTGELTLKDVTHEIVFPATIGPTPEGVLAADAHFDIDRTRWNVIYGSGKFYQKLGMHLVHDFISLALKVVTIPVKAA